MKPKHGGKLRIKKAGISESHSVSHGKERLILVLSLVGFAIILVLMATFAGRVHQERAISKRLSKWKTLYQLDEKQVRKVREIELRFHGNPITSRDSGTPVENADHHLEISRVMMPEDAERFLRNIERGKGRH